MSVIALLFLGTWFLVVFVGRTWVQLRRTGDSGWRAGRLAGQVGTTEWWAGLSFVVALLVGVAAPIADLAGLELLFDVPALQVVGLVLTLVGGGLTFVAQMAMGRSWRIGVDETERTTLVTGGAFSLVRNPIFTTIGVTAFGLFLMVPNWVSLTALVLLVASVEVQVRRVEEPYLRRVHGREYADYSAQVGRFVPGVGRG